MITCEFIQGTKKNANTGFVKHEIFCGKPAAKYKCSGELSSICMSLCEFHKNFVVNHYKWNVTTLSSELRAP